VHGGQQLRLFNAYYDDYGFQPIVVFDAEGRFVTALLRPGKRPSGVEIRGFVRRLVGALQNREITSLHLPSAAAFGTEEARSRAGRGSAH
jgi:hypothetical protein